MKKLSMMKKKMRRKRVKSNNTSVQLTVIMNNREKEVTLMF